MGVYAILAILVKWCVVYLGRSRAVVLSVLQRAPRARQCSTYHMALSASAGLCSALSRVLAVLTHMLLRGIAKVLHTPRAVAQERSRMATTQTHHDGGGQH
eukprot:12927465-Alexandrium_andersonii.AAC.1